MADTLAVASVVAADSVSAVSLVGTRLNGFVITGTVSTGGMGVVYEAMHPLIGRRAAVKVIRPELCSDVGLTARFLREARAVSAVKHRNVVEILDFGALPDGGQYMMMEFLEGDTLAQVIARDAPMRPAEALHICLEILSGLSAAHQVGVVHRDLKPANIVLMRQSSGELIVKVLDFGLARQLDTAPEPTTRESLRELSLEKSSLLAGTPEYISPEQASGEQVGAQGDLYCLGVILYEMLSGRLPFSASSPWELMQQHRLVEPTPLGVIASGLDPQLAAFVMRLLKKDPAERPLGALAASRELSELGEPGNSSRLADTWVVDREREPGLGRLGFWLSRALASAGAAAIVGLLGIGLTAAMAPPQPAEPDAPPHTSATITMAVASTPAPAEALIELRAPGPKPRARPVASATCEANDSWRRAAREQLEDLEKLSLSKLKDDALPSEVAKTRQKARSLATAVRTAQAGGCQQVEADLRSWRAGLQ